MSPVRIAEGSREVPQAEPVFGLGKSKVWIWVRSGVAAGNRWNGQTLKEGWCWARSPLGGKVQEGVRVCWQQHDVRTASEHLAPFRMENQHLETNETQLLLHPGLACVS